MPIPATPLRDTESLKLSLLRFRDQPTTDSALDLVDEIITNPEPLPAQVFDLISAAGRAAALISWVGYHLENPHADHFTLPGNSREW